jgi:hypothetical protein
MLQVMLYGYPIEKLCTYQYSLISLIPGQLDSPPRLRSWICLAFRMSKDQASDAPGLLLSLSDAGSSELATPRRRTRPTSFRSADRRSLLRLMGLPLHLFGEDAFFQPYLPLQQVEQLAAKSWLVGTSNQIVTQQRDGKYDLLVNVSMGTDHIDAHRTAERC